MPYDKKYRKSMPMSSNYSKGEIGCIKAPAEHQVEMLKNGGGKYSYNNPMELKQHADALAKVVK